LVLEHAPIITCNIVSFDPQAARGICQIRNTKCSASSCG
jgi:hypothetical protein